MKVERVVLDTNVLISAILSPHGKPAACFDWVIAHAKLLASHELVDELRTRIARPKFDKYLSAERRLSVIDDVLKAARLISVTGNVHACRDPDDDKILEIAVTGSADCSVTGDQDLLVLDPFRNIPILSPAQFLDAVR